LPRSLCCLSYWGVLACSGPGLADEAGSTTDPGGETTGEGDGDGDGDADLPQDEGDGDGDAEPFCGDGKVDPFELCDDGDGCEADCTLPACSLAWLAVDADKTLSSINNFGPTPIVVRGDGVVVSAHEGDDEFGINVRVQALTGEGDLLWAAAHAFDTQRDKPNVLIADAAGDLYLGVSINASTASRAAIVKLSGLDGSVLWQYEHEGLFSAQHNRAAHLEFDGAGRLIAALVINEDESGTNVVIAALDPDAGSPEWIASWSGPLGLHGQANDRTNKFVIDPADDSIYVLADRNPDSNLYAPMLLRFEPPATVATLAVDIHPGAPTPASTGASLALTSTGELVALLQSTTGEGFTLVGLAKPTGALQWQRSSIDYGLGVGEARAFGLDMLARPSGGVAVTGWGSDLTQPLTQGFMLALDANQDLHCLGLLDQTLDNLSGSPFPFDLAVGPDAERIYASGFTLGGGARRFIAAWD